MARSNRAGLEAEIIVDQRAIMEALKEYFLTPPELRGEVQSLGALARYLGCTEGTLSMAMASQPSMGSDILQATAMAGAVQIPRILYKLMEAIEHGSIKAAEIYLDHIRKTIHDERFMLMAEKASHDLTGVMENMGSQVELLLRAASQPDAEAARRHLSGPVTRTPEGFAARAEVALESDRSIPKATVVEDQT